MGTTNNRKEIIILGVYSILILIYAVFDILTVILPKFHLISIKLNVDFISYFFIYTGIFLYTTPINIIVGYGLLRRRFWARYAAMAVMLTFPIIIFTQYLYWGHQSFHLDKISVQLIFVIITLFYFSRKTVKSLFGEARSFRFISWHGLLAIMIILISFFWIFFSLYWKVHAARNFGYPLLIDRPEIIVLEKSKNPESLEKYRKVLLLNASLFIPKEFYVRRLTRIEGKEQKWVVSLQNQGVNTKGFIIFGNDFSYDELFTDGESRKLLGSRSKFDVEKYILTNNWNPGLVAIRSLIRPKGEGFIVREIHTNGLRGFLKGWQRGDAFFREFSIYSRDNTQCIVGTIMSIKGYLDEKDILTILSSIEFLRPEDSGQSKNHFENGLKLYKQGDILQAQIEFANAYCLFPENPDYTLMFAKSLYLKDQKYLDYTHIKDLLSKVLKQKPNDKDARKLLKEIEPKLSKGALVTGKTK